MANWYGMSRSNYFRVKDVEAFKNWCELWDLEFIVQEERDEAGKLIDNQRYGFITNDYDGAWPVFRELKEGEEGYKDPDSTEEYVDNEVELSFEADLPKYLADGEVAVLISAGAEKARYITGHAFAIHSSGDVTFINLDDIYDKAADVFEVDIKSITHATY